MSFGSARRTASSGRRSDSFPSPAKARYRPLPSRRPEAALRKRVTCRDHPNCQAEPAWAILPIFGTGLKHLMGFWASPVLSHLRPEVPGRGEGHLARRSPSAARSRRAGTATARGGRRASPRRSLVAAAGLRGEAGRPARAKAQEGSAAAHAPPDGRTPHQGMAARHPPPAGPHGRTPGAGRHRITPKSGVSARVQEILETVTYALSGAA